MSLRGLTPAEGLDKALAGNRHAIGRLLTLVERGGEPADEVASLTHSRGHGATVIGITGPPGAGKSTLVGQLIKEATKNGARPAILAVDPSSPLSGGAILGDRIRMDDPDSDSFIRSIATRGHSGGLALAVPGAVRVFDACGFDPIIIETVGVGQVEVDVTATADTTIVVMNPGTGDAVQANKAGLLEVADIFVVNKADRPGANEVRGDLQIMLDLSHMTGREEVWGRRPPVVMLKSLEGVGFDELWQEIQNHRLFLDQGDGRSVRQELRQEAEVEARLEQILHMAASDMMASVEGAKIMAELKELTLAPATAARQLAKLLLEGN